MKPSIFVTRLLPENCMKVLNETFELEVNLEDRVLNKEEIIQKAKNKDALLCLLTDTIDEEVILSCSNLKVISNYAVGYNNIDVKAATAQKVPVCITPGVLTDTTADLAWALLMAVSRRIVESDTYTRAGKFKGWGPLLLLGTDIHHKTLGIIGMGRIGLAMARRAKGFDMNIIYTSNSRVDEAEKELDAQQVDLETLLKTSDFVSLHVPFTPENHHLIDAKALKTMKSSAFLINTARGPIVDEKALIHALQQGEIAGAGLDVFENEPELMPGLIDCNNAVIVPHIGSATHETRTQMGMLAYENAKAIFEGHIPKACVNPEVFK